MTSFSKHEIIAAHDRYLALRKAIERGDRPWSDLGSLFTNDATFIDPAWGRVEGRDNIVAFLDESMAGLEGWTFPHEHHWVDEDRLVTRWYNRLPGQRADGSFYEAVGYSYFTYAGNGAFSYEEDLLNMVHIGELIKESGWRPGPGFNTPPRHPIR